MVTLNRNWQKAITNSIVIVVVIQFQQLYTLDGAMLYHPKIFGSLIGVGREEIGEEETAEEGRAEGVCG